MANGRDDIYATLLGRIEAGTYPPGTKLPPGRALASELGVTLWATRNAMLALEDDGFVESRPPVGVFVRDNVALDKVRRHKNSLGKTVTVLASRSFFYVTRGYVDIIGDMERCLGAQGCEVNYEEMPDGAKALERFLAEAAEAETKALVVFPEQREWDILFNHTDIFRRYPVNILYFNRGSGPIDSLPFHCVGVDIGESGALAARWTQQHGIKHVAYLTFNSFHRYWVRTRLNGFRGVMERGGASYQLFSAPEPGEALNLALDFVKNSPEPPALVACNDVWAVPIHDSLAAHGLKAGSHYHLVSFDCMPSCKDYKFVNIGWPLEKVGGLLAEVVLDPHLAKSQEFFVIKYQLKPIIIDRTKP